MIEMTMAIIDTMTNSNSLVSQEPFLWHAPLREIRKLLAFFLCIRVAESRRNS